MCLFVLMVGIHSDGVHAKREDNHDEYIQAAQPSLVLLSSMLLIG